MESGGNQKAAERERVGNKSSGEEDEEEEGGKTLMVVDGKKKGIKLLGYDKGDGTYWEGEYVAIAIESEDGTETEYCRISEV